MLDFISDLGPFVGVGPGRFGPVDHGPDTGQFCVECRESSLIVGHIFFGEDSIHRAFWNAYCTVNALVGVDYQEVGTHSEAINRAHVNTIRVPSQDAGFCDHVGHDLS